MSLDFLSRNLSTKISATRLYSEDMHSSTAFTAVEAAALVDAEEDSDEIDIIYYSCYGDLILGMGWVGATGIFVQLVSSIDG